MVKLVYPKEGIKKYIINDLEMAKLNVSNAIKNNYFSVPSDFRYSRYLSNLKSDLNSYKKKVENIIDYVNQEALNYTICGESIISDNKTLEKDSVKKRDRLIN